MLRRFYLSMENYYSIIISQKELHQTEKFKKTDWVSWCWEYVGIDNFSWTIDVGGRGVEEDITNRGRYIYVIRFEHDEDKLLFILNWL